MNYLAHAFLSGPNPDLLIGNFIADGVRGKQLFTYPEGIQQGILLHRKIDHFTDNHAVVAESKARLREKFGKYAPVITDMFYDHFLADQFVRFSATPLAQFALDVYALMNRNFELLPEKLKHLLPYMEKQNWLVSYAQLSGINQALTGLSRRTSFFSGMENAASELKKNYGFYENEFSRFFPELILFAEENIAGLLPLKPENKI